MIGKLLSLCGVIVFLLLCAFSTGNPLYLLGALVVLFCILFCMLSVETASKKLRLTMKLEQDKAMRGETAVLHIDVNRGTLFPIASLRLTFQEMNGLPASGILISSGHRECICTFTPVHVGTFYPGVSACTVRDVLGLYEKTVYFADRCPPLCVMPTPFAIDELPFSPGEAGLGTMARASEDLAFPTDVRQYQVGDSLKKIHWKMYLRKHELYVRRFEEQDQPDALLVTDFSCPQYPDDASDEQKACLRDALYETAASVGAMLLKTDHPIRVSAPVVYDKIMGLNLLLERFAAQPLTFEEPFEKIVRMEMRNLRRTGTVAVVTSRLNSGVVDAVGKIRRSGPFVRLYLISYDGEGENALYVSRLQQQNVQVCYVTPVASLPIPEGGVKLV